MRVSIKRYFWKLTCLPALIKTYALLKLTGVDKGSRMTQINANKWSSNTSVKSIHQPTSTNQWEFWTSMGSPQGPDGHRCSAVRAQACWTLGGRTETFHEKMDGFLGVLRIFIWGIEASIIGIKHAWTMRVWHLNSFEHWNGRTVGYPNIRWFIIMTCYSSSSS